MTSTDKAVAGSAGYHLLDPFRTACLSAQQTIVMLRYRRILWVALIALILMGGFAYVLAAFASDKTSGINLYCMLGWWGLGTVVVPWATLYLGVQAVHGELEDRTSQYLFLRPVHRVALLLGKWAAIALVASIIACCSATVVYLGATSRADLWPDGGELRLLVSFCKVLSMGAVSYAAVAVFFGATFRRPLAWAAVFVIGLQMVVANLPVSAGLRQLTITDPMRRMILDLIEPDRRLARILWPFERNEALEVDLEPVGAFRFELGSPLCNLLILIAVCLVAASLRYATAEYESKSRD